MNSPATRDSDGKESPNVRQRAVETLRILEWAELMASDSLKRVRQVGRHLYLAYEAKEGRFRWRRLGRRDHIRQVIGARLPREWWDRIYRPTRERVATIERMLDTRSGLRRALNLARSMGVHWEETEADVLQLEWRAPTVSGDHASAKWTIAPTGAVTHKASYHVGPDGLAAGVVYLPSLTREARWEVEKREQTPGAGAAVQAAAMVVAAVDAQQRRLEEWQAIQSGDLRVYYNARYDTWHWRQCRGRAGAAVPMSIEAVAAAIGERGPQLVAAWEDFVRWRRARRVLLLMAVLGNAAIQFPVGGWSVRGRGAKDLRWGWMVNAMGRSILRRDYRRMMPAGPTDIETVGSDEDGGWSGFGWWS